MIQLSSNWSDFEVLDAGDQEKLERWGNYILRRPDPQAIWAQDPLQPWDKANMFYHRSSKGGGFWDKEESMPASWNISLGKMKFIIHPTAFKHTGLFPEQAANWEWLINKIQSSKKNIKVLNLFAYTGGATVACALAGAEVCHVDASKGMIQVAKENIQISNLKDAKVRFIVDDAVKFVEREIRRGSKYEGIIMDPPAYGRGPTGELWEIEKDLMQLIELCKQILSDEYLFVLINAYATSFSSLGIENILKTCFKADHKELKIESGENALLIKKRDLLLPCGLFARLERLI